MKKILFVLLCLLFIGCSNNKNVDDNNVTISNPIIEVNSKEELEAMSYYQLAKIYVYKGEKDKAINFLNKAIEVSGICVYNY